MEQNPSLYEMLFQNFTGERDLAAVDEQRQPLRSVLDNLQRILNSRAGALSHLVDHGLPDMSEVLQGLPASAHGLVDTLSATLLKYEPRLARLEVELLPQRQPGHLEYGVRVWLKDGEQGCFTTCLGPEGCSLNTVS
jgi:type VI secretion system protein